MKEHDRTPRPELREAAVSIRLLRGVTGLSQREFGKLVGACQWTLAAWEAGWHRPTPKHIQLLNELSRDYIGRPLFVPTVVPEPVRLPPQQALLRSAQGSAERGLPHFGGEDAA